MPIAATDLKFFQSANNPEDDAGVSGGAIATAGIVEFTDIAATDSITMISDGVDTRTVTVTGRLASGAIDSEALVLNGATRVVGVKLFERILKIVLSASDAARTVTVTRNNTPTFTVIATLGPNITSSRRLFYNSASAASQKIRYEKSFAKNTHATLTLNSAILKLTADPSATIRIALATAKDDVGSVANRLTLPAGLTFVDDNVIANVPTGLLNAAEAIGVWIEQTLAANAAPVKSTFSIELSGTTT